MKLGLVAEPDLVKELIALLAISQKPAAVKKPRLFVDFRQCLVNGDLIRKQLNVVSGQTVSGGFATAQFLVQPSQRLVWANHLSTGGICYGSFHVTPRLQRSQKLRFFVGYC